MKRRALAAVNAAVLLFGLAGLFAKWIDLSALAITFGRVLFSSLALGLFLLAGKRSFRVSGRDLGRLAAAGAILALHWWAFLSSVQWATVAVGTLTFAAFPLFVTLLEPAVFRRKPSKKSILAALAILLGVIVTVPAFSFENRMFRGILAGLLSALAYAVLTVMNKGFASRLDGALTAFYEQAAAALLLLPMVLAAGCFRPALPDLGLLLILGVVTTALAHTLFISGLKALPARTAGLFSSLETVYGILFALLLLGEVPSLREVLGCAIILGAVLFSQLTEREA
ncbi:MAG: DMT family transporter [Oscillospiraceae bacterium]|nr:DMT family transporter [Oscillospiraceae bacterium]